MKLIRHVRVFKEVKAYGVFVSNGKYDISLANGQSSINDVSIGLHLLNSEHANAIRGFIAASENIDPCVVDLSTVELRSVSLAVDDMQRHTSGVMLEYLSQIAPEHSGQASALVETLYAKIRARARRTEKCASWNDLVGRRGFGKSSFRSAVESLEAIPNKCALRDRLLNKLSSDWPNYKTVQVTMALTKCARDKVIVGEINRWTIDRDMIAAVCRAAVEQDQSDEEQFKLLCTLIVDMAPQLMPAEINALAIYEMTEWSLSQTRV